MSSLSRFQTFQIHFSTNFASFINMAWFSSIVNGVGSAANWLLSNSGLVGKVLSTVGTVAQGNLPSTVTTEGFVMVENGGIAAEDCDCGGDLAQTFQYATRKLERAAQEGEKAPKMPIRGSQDSAILSGLWTNPGLTIDGTATPEMYRDMGKFLAENNIPTELKTTNKDGTGTLDVSQTICDSIFADAPGIPESSEVEAVAVKVAEFEIPGDGCTISGSHAYYSIPLGKRNYGPQCDDQAWHGAVRVTRTSTAAFDIEHRKQMKENFYVAQTVETAGTGPRWVVTCQVNWRTISLAKRAREKVKAELLEYHPTYQLLYSAVTGQNQTIKIRAPEGVTPASVRAILNQVVTNAAKSVTQGASQILNGEPLSDSMLSSQVRSVLNLVVSETERKLTGQIEKPEMDSTLQTPEVTVTNSTLVT